MQPRIASVLVRHSDTSAPARAVAQGTLGEGVITVYTIVTPVGAAAGTGWTCHDYGRPHVSAATPARRSHPPVRNQRKRRRLDGPRACRYARRETGPIRRLAPRRARAR